ncbi:hypothetical protein EIN_530940, partial [Entamoeba invadens IP1]
MTSLDSFNIVVVSKYFTSIQDFIHLVLVCKKFRSTFDQFHANPIPLTTKTIKHFPNIETLNLWSKEDETFGNVISEIPSKPFFAVIVWYPCDYSYIKTYESTNVKFMNITYNLVDFKKYGSDIPKYTKTLGSFCYATKPIASLTLPDTLQTIMNNCFNSCTLLKSIRLSPFTTSIQSQCFIECVSLQSILIPSGVDQIGSSL